MFGMWVLWDWECSLSSLVELHGMIALPQSEKGVSPPPSLTHTPVAPVLPHLSVLARSTIEILRGAQKNGNSVFDSSTHREQMFGMWVLWDWECSLSSLVELHGMIALPQSEKGVSYVVRLLH